MPGIKFIAYVYATSFVVAVAVAYGEAARGRNILFWSFAICVELAADNTQIHTLTHTHTQLNDQNGLWAFFWGRGVQLQLMPKCGQRLESVASLESGVWRSAAFSLWAVLCGL